MGKLQLRVAFDFINEKGEVAPAVKDYSNGFIIPLDVTEVNDRDCYLMKCILQAKIADMTTNEHLYHLFGLYQFPDKIPEGIIEKARCKVPGRFLQYSFADIELKEPHNNTPNTSHGGQ